MKIIDLLNKIANGEEVPEKVRYNNEIYDTETSNNFSLMIYEAIGKMCDDGEVQLFLNDEVEILEEKKIPEKLELIKNGDFVEMPDSKDLMNKINEIIDFLKAKEMNKL